MVTDRSTDETRQESLWTMMFADDIMICSESGEQVEANLERRRDAQERKGVKISESRTQYICVSETDNGRMMELQRVKEVETGEYNA